MTHSDFSPQKAEYEGIEVRHTPDCDRVKKHWSVRGLQCSCEAVRGLLGDRTGSGSISAPQPNGRISAVEADVVALLTKPPQRPHHWMNADGTCHAGDLFESGAPAMPLYTAEQMDAWVRAERDALATAVDEDWMLACDTCGRRYGAHEDLRGKGADGLTEARRRAAADGWVSIPGQDQDWCSEHNPPPEASGSLEVVEWVDTTNVQEWTSLAEIADWAADGGYNCRNVGYLVHEDDECVVLAARIATSAEPTQAGLYERIPKGVITARHQVFRPGTPAGGDDRG